MRVVSTIAASLVFVLASGAAQACATCYGAPEDPQTQGMNMAIFTLLGVTYGVFALMAGTGIALWYTNRRTSAEGDKDEALEPEHG